MRCLVPLVLLACQDPEEPAESEPSVPTEGPDPLAEALGGCLSTGEQVDDDLGFLHTQVEEYDEHGDVVHEYADYEDDEAFYDWDIVYKMGEPHQAVKAVVTFTRPEVSGWTSRYTWEDGNIVLEEQDYDSDGSVEETTVSEFEPGTPKLVHREFDLDGDGVFEGQADATWEAQGEDWLMRVEGEDPGGSYSIEELYDAQFRSKHFHMERDDGYAYDLEITSRSSLGLAGDSDEVTYQDGEMVEEESKTISFDELGRLIKEVHYKAAYEDGELVGDFTRTTTTNYDCP
jgi:hypothetical protein